MYLCVYLCALCVLLIVISQAAVHGLQLALQSSCSLLERAHTLLLFLLHVLRIVSLKNMLLCHMPVSCEGGPRMFMPFVVPCNRIASIDKGVTTIAKWCCIARW